MSDSILTKDILFHNKIDKMSDLQKYKYSAMLKINHIINCALEDDRERSSGKCYVMQFSKFLEKIGKAFDDTIVQTDSCQNNIIIFDDFIRIAEYAYAAIKEIVNGPSLQLEKVACKVPVQKATGMGIKTMKWIAERPGRTVQEKVSPQNKVLTSKTVFSADTKENREFMYMHKILHEAILARVTNSECRSCKNKDCKYYNWIIKINKLFSLPSKIRKTELKNVKPIKQSTQNNKLMCDKNYRIIWNAVKMLSDVEDKIEVDFNDTLESRFSMVVYWVILSRLISYDNVMVYDFVGRFYDKGGIIGFGDENGKKKKIYDEHTIIIKKENNEFAGEFVLKIDDTDISIADKSGNGIYAFSSKNYFDTVEYIMKGSEENKHE